MARVMVPGHKVCSSRSAQNAVANQAEVMPMSMQGWLLNWERGPEKMGLERGREEVSRRKHVMVMVKKDKGLCARFDAVFCRMSVGQFVMLRMHQEVLINL